MREQIVTKGIVLARTDYQEADRILTVLTPDNGKLRVIAKGVRRPKSKLAGGIELFSINDLTILPSKSDIKTLISSRLDINFGNIITDIKRTMLGYELLKHVNRVTEDEPEEEYFGLIANTLKGLDDLDLPAEALELWFNAKLLYITGHTPNLKTDSEGAALAADELYLFDFDEMSFRHQKGGPYGANHIKLLRLGVAADSPLVLKQVEGSEKYVTEALLLSKNILKQHLRI